MNTENTALINIDRALFNNDFGALTPDERVLHGKRMCEAVGIDYRTQPIKWIQMRGGKLVPYADKNCSDQLRAKHDISVEVTSRDIKDGLLTVHARATTPNGRRDEDFGVVLVAGLRGEDAANAVMKAVTKAKRRVTLSICGLGGLLDESEIGELTPTFDDLGRGTPKLTADSLPPSAIKTPEPRARTLEELNAEAAEQQDDYWAGFCNALIAQVRAAPSADEIYSLKVDNFTNLVKLKDADPAKCEKLDAMIEHEIARRTKQDEA